MTTLQKRKHDRYPVNISCELIVSGQRLHAEMKNLSGGGAAIVFQRSVTVGEVLTVSFFLTEDGIEDPESVPFECAASVRWCKPVGARGFEAGLQFLSPSSDQRELLKDFLKRAG
ncbi:MAG: PilZ domain-containing protein [Deltaproteobacteria bacterium]|nr:PilZ domain-containing protein [Deltaproteobacteria bacterium]